MAEPNDDIFEEIHHTEEADVQRGREAGIRDGMVAGVHEGRELGLQKGYEIGAELGFYAGCAQAWRALHAMQSKEQLDAPSNPSTADTSQQPSTSSTPTDPATQSSSQHNTNQGFIPPRAEKALAGLEELLSQFPTTDPQDERLHELLDRIRGRFKVVVSILGLLHEYLPKEVAAPGQAGQAAGTDMTF